eukprot:TRINITY_DN18060_c0_g1_i1.p1 TRINITY_DN18060_c0_g1~~TRINITY_DN18060_c0_g1_i1.p1  ORF type:complete len:498 (+),score=78.60 TRINITY_DN18060_c0_g1_i1:103-1596(+)
MAGECITVHIGQAGCQIGESTWELFCHEHQVQPDGKRAPDANQEDSTYQSFFSETSSGQHVPRAVFVDTDPTSRDEIFNSPYGSLYHPESVLGYKQDCKNNFFEGRSMAAQYKIKDDVMDRIRIAVDSCSNLQGFCVFHSFGGGTGSGIGVEVLHELHEQFDKKVILQPLIYPSAQFSSCIVEPYNCIFATYYTRDVVDLSLMMDNQAAYRMCSVNLGIPNPDFEHVNKVIAQCVSACTTSLRFESQLNASMAEIVTNLVPTQHFRYAIVSLSPVRDAAKGGHEQFSTEEICTDLFERRNLLCDCGEHLKQNRYLSAVVLLRGLDDATPGDGESKSDTKSSTGKGGGGVPIEVNRVLSCLQKLANPVSGYRIPIRFVPWLTSAFKVGLVSEPPSVPGGFMAETKRQGAMLGNSTAVRQLFVRQYSKFLKLFYHRAYVWQFLESNGEIDLFYEARDGVKQMICHYEELLNQCVQGENDKQGETVVRLEGKTSLGQQEG